MDSSPEPMPPAAYSVPSSLVRWTTFVAIALLGLGLRLPQLGVRPMHTDEAVNAYIVGQLLAGRPFSYDAHQSHGPALFALAVPLARIQGAKTFADLTEPELRLASVLAGTATILLFGAAVDIFGFLPCLIAALLFAVAPLPVYYDRYFIHESLFVAATLGLILAASRAFQRPLAGSAAVCAALMLAAKETALIHFMAMAAAGFVYWRWNLRGARLSKSWHLKPTLAAIAVFLLLSALMFTWFGTNPGAITTLFHAPPALLDRAAGQGHQKPVWYYAQLLAGGWSGATVCVLALIGILHTTVKRTPSTVGFLAFYSVFLATIYSLIPYKTPWLALNLWLPLALFAGLAIQQLWRRMASRPALRLARPICAALAAILLAALLARDTRLRVFQHPADESNPYAYAHTSDDLGGLPAEIDRLAAMDGIAQPRIAVIAADPWPLPWYLRHYPNTGYWQPGQQSGSADFYITSSQAADQYADQFRHLHSDFFGVRPGVLVLLWAPAPK